MRKINKQLPTWQKIKFNIKINDLESTISKLLSDKLDKSKYINRPIQDEKVRINKIKRSVAKAKIKEITPAIKEIKQAPATQEIKQTPEIKQIEASSEEEIVLLDDEEFTDLINELESN